MNEFFGGLMNFCIILTKHPNVKFTVECEDDGKLLFLGYK